ncbi:hypothetical protein [Streptomyces sp. ODS28]|uniref:hypothetical protein n=1 Tax=Streptomyces sp. ODS28 TaxID=3136688 RepID=UPI0031E60855
MRGRGLRQPSGLRAWTVGWPTGAAHSLGVALLAVTELVRWDVGPYGLRRPDGEVPLYAAEFGRIADTLGGQPWYRLATRLWEAMTFGEPRAVLWAAVCAALVVRLNREGPPLVQCVLSVLSALYCIPAALAGLPYLALAGWYALPFVLTFGAVVTAAATRRGTPLRDTPERASP